MALAETLLDTFCTIIIQRCLGEIKPIESDFHEINSFLTSYAKAKGGDSRSSPPNWLVSIREACFEAEDLIEMYYLGEEYREKTSILHKLVSIHEYASQIKSYGHAKLRIQKAANHTRLRKQWIEHLKLNTCLNEQKPVRECIPCGQEKFTIGLLEDAKTLISELTTRRQTRLRSVSIVGMGGIGKTTLAGKVYTYPDVQKHFRCQLWIPVTRKFHYRDLLLAILLMKPATASMSQRLGELQDDELENQVHQLLRGQRYLVVLDDVWDQDQWDCLKSAFPDTSMGSKLILTTRNGGLETGMPGICHQMKTLNEEQSQKLFLEVASLEEGDSIFLDIQKKLLQKCDGLPLAIAVIGAELKMKSRGEQWKTIYHDLMSMQGAIGRDIFTTLALSYDNLTHDLRSCFLRVSFFPEGQEISARKLIYLWAAHDLLPDFEVEGIEKVGQTLLYRLTERNMIQTAAKSLDGADLKRWKLHPLMHKFSATKAKEDIFFQTQRHRTIDSSSSSFSSFDQPPRLPFFMSNGNSEAWKNQHLHSLLAFMPDANSVYPNMLIVCSFSKLLKVLYLESMDIRKLPSAIGYLRNLRYLNLSKNCIGHLPRSMRFLLRLVILDVRKNAFLKGINVVKTLVNLKILHLDQSLEQLRIGSLSRLCTLGWVQSQQLTRDGIASVKNTIKVLKIAVTDPNRCEELFQSMASLTGLECLKLHISCQLSSFLPEGMFNGMVKLKTLQLRGSNNSGVFQVPTEELENLPSLSILKLQSVSTSESEFPISRVGFPQLVHLQLHDVWNLQSFRKIEGKEAMPKLKRLLISACPGIQSTTLEHFIARGVLEFTDSIYNCSTPPYQSFYDAREE